MPQLRDRIDRDSRTRRCSRRSPCSTTAQITADATVAQADEYSARVMTEARELYDDTRRHAAVLEQETQDKAKAVYEDALLRVEAFERENAERLAQLTVDTDIAQREVDEQTAYLKTLRDAARTQLEIFLEGMLDHVTEAYGRANPAAANAANGLVDAPTTVTQPTSPAAPDSTNRAASPIPIRRRQPSR